MFNGCVSSIRCYMVIWSSVEEIILDGCCLSGDLWWVKCGGDNPRRVSSVKCYATLWPVWVWSPYVCSPVGDQTAGTIFHQSCTTFVSCLNILNLLISHYIANDLFYLFPDFNLQILYRNDTNNIFMCIMMSQCASSHVSRCHNRHKLHHVHIIYEWGSNLLWNVSSDFVVKNEVCFVCTLFTCLIKKINIIFM